MFKTPLKVRPWASAAGVAALVLGSVSGLAGSASAAEVQGAANAAAPAQTGSSISTSGKSATPFIAKSAAAKTSSPTAKSAKGAAYKYFDHAFIERLRASAIQVEADIAHPLVPGVGYTAVNLEKDLGGEFADCEIFGAGAYFTDVVQEGVFENSGPPDAGNKGGGIFNPTESKDTKPNLSPGENLNTRKPGLRDVSDGHRIMEIPHEGNGVHWKGLCDADNGGKATGNNLDVAGIYAVGSTTSGAVNKSTGEYTGASRAYVAGLGPAGMDFVQSFAVIKQLPAQKPVVSYRIGVNGTTTAAGTNVPYGDITKTFNETMQSQHGLTAPIGPTGNLLALMGPTESESENGGRYIINFPFFEVQQGLEARKGGIGHNQRFRLVNIDYEGESAGAAIKAAGTGNHS